MKSWNYQPAKDLELKPVGGPQPEARVGHLVHLRAPGLARSGRAYMSLYHRLDVEG